MSRIFKNLAQVKGSVLVITLLLIVQAYCELALPSYTSDIVDVGIQQGGIDHIAPEKMTRETYDRLCLLLEDDEEQTMQAAYICGEEICDRKSGLSEETLQELDEMLGIPMLLIDALGDARLSMLIENSDMMAEFADASVWELAEKGMIDKQQILQFKSAAQQQMSESMGSLSQSAIQQRAVLFVQKEYERAGIDLGRLQIRYLLKTGAVMLLYAIISMMAAVFVGFLAARSGARIGRSLRSRVFRKVVSFSNHEINQFSTASLITRSTNDIQQVQMVTIMLLRMVLYAPIIGIGGIIKVSNTKTGLGWIIAVAVAVICALVFTLMAVAMPKFKIMQTLVDRLNLVAREILTGIPVIRAFSREEHEEKRFAEANRDLMRTQLFTNRVMTFMMPLMMLLMNAISVAIVWFGAKGVDLGQLQVGDMMAFITYTMMIVMAFLMITMMSIMLPRAGVAAARIDEVIKSVSSITDREDCVTMPADQVKGELTFHDVSFYYDGASDAALEHISFTARPGETTAIIGSTGSGKSTLIHLIDRFFDVTQGSITIDGVDIRDMSQHDLHALIGLVPQKGVLFSGTIASNICFDGDYITSEKMQEAAEIAQAAEFIEEKPQGYDSPIAQGGTNVSGGQKQRLSIARAIAKEPKIYLFDDSFSALDYKTDTQLRKALREKTREAAVIIVAQRISTIMHAQQIIVLDEGTVAGVGTHQQLLASCEAYQEIARSQLSEEELRGGMA